MQGWMLSCGGEEEVAAMGVDRMAAMTDPTTTALMLLRLRLQEQALDGVMITAV